MPLFGEKGQQIAINQNDIIYYLPIPCRIDPGN